MRCIKSSAVEMFMLLFVTLSVIFMLLQENDLGVVIEWIVLQSWSRGCGEACYI